MKREVVPEAAATGASGKMLVGMYGFGFARWAKHFHPNRATERDRLRYYTTVFNVEYPIPRG